MKYSRRDFVKLGGLGVGAALFGTEMLYAGVNGNMAGDTSAAGLLFQSSENFTALIGSNFTIYKDDGAVNATLITVKDFSPPRPSRKTRQKRTSGPYSLAFELHDAELAQNTYDLFHPKTGLFRLLMVPGENTAGQPLLVAVINRI
jgi:hypothetical protein